MCLTFESRVAGVFFARTGIQYHQTHDWGRARTSRDYDYLAKTDCGDTLAGVLEHQVKGWILGERPEVTSAELGDLVKRYIEEDSNDTSEEDDDDAASDVDLNAESK